MFYHVNYIAPCILRMIQNIITEDVFRKGVIKYLHAQWVLFCIII